MLNQIQKLLQRLRRKKTQNYIDKLKNNGLSIGSKTNIFEPFFLDPEHCFLISIGNNCTLAPNVRLIAHDASTKQFLNYTRIGKITIHDNCFIGDSSIVLPNVSIGPNTIIGSNSLVNKDIPDNVVAAGNPAKVICKLDEYLEKIRAKESPKGVFGKDYLLSNINAERKQKILDSLENGEGFII